MSFVAGATDYTWSGVSAGDWEEPENWVPNTGYPHEAGDRVTIPNPVGGSERVTVTVNSPIAISQLTVGAAIGAEGIATLCFKTGLATNEVSGDVKIGGGGVLTHFGPNDTITQRLALRVGGDMSIDPSGKVDVMKKGYSDHKGPGNKRCTPMYAGTTAEFCNWSNPLSNGRCYGSIREPLDYGSGTHEGGDYTMGGGSVYLDIAGTLTLNGTITSSAAQGESSWVGAPGSILVKCGTLFGAGIIEARAGYGSYGESASTSGGRIALYQRASASLGGFTGTIRTGRAAASNGTCGTIYLENNGDTPGEGTLIVDNDGTLRDFSTDIDPQVADASLPFGSVIVRNGGRLRVCNGATLKVTKSISVSSNSRLVTAAGHLLELVGDDDCTITGGSYMTLESLVCTNAGKTIRFGTAAADKITIAKDKRLVLRGTAEHPIVLASAQAGVKWPFCVDADAGEVDVAHVNVQDSNASSGACVVSIDGTDLGNNDYWGFSSPIASGEAISWTGAADTAWQNPANWSRTRVPVSTDLITIPATGTGRYPTLGYGTYLFNRLTVADGASLTVNTAVTTVTNMLTVAGSLVFTGDESFSIEGDADFTGGTVTPAQSRIYLTGVGDQTTDFGGTTLNMLQWQKPSGNLSFGASGFTAAAFSCSVTTASEIEFAAGATYTFPSLSLAGTSSKLLSLVSSSPGTKWKLITTAEGQNLSGVAASDSDASEGATVMAGRQSSAVSSLNWDTETEIAAWVGGDGSFTDAAKWSTGAVPGPSSRVSIVGSASETFAVTLPADSPVSLGSLSVKGAVGGKVKLVANSPLTVLGDCEVWEYGELELNCYNDAGAAPNVVSNNVHVRSGGVITHKKGSNTENAKVHLAVLGDMTVEEGGSVSASAKGYGQKSGPGYGQGNCHGAAFASYGYQTPRNPYGSILRPVSWGSSIDRAYNSGGAVHLVVTGTLTVNGTVESDGEPSGGSLYTMSGGSVWIECAALTGSGYVTARESYYTTARNSLDTKGTGGRIAVYQRTATDFTASRRSAFSRTATTTTRPARCISKARVRTEAISMSSPSDTTPRSKRRSRCRTTAWTTASIRT